MTNATRTSRAAARKASDARIAEAFAAAQAIVSTGRCPDCGSALKRNSSLHGWWQCEQSGAPTFMARPNDPSCSFQCFTA